MSAVRTLILCVLGAASVGGAAADQPEPAKFERFWVPAVYRPLDDPDLGRLYRPAVELLHAARSLPKSIDLGEAASAGGEVVPAEPPPAAREEAVEPSAPSAPGPERWVIVSDRPVVGEEDLAYAYFRGGYYTEAAETYRRLLEGSSGDSHLLIMLMLAERNSGNDQEVGTLLAELEKDEDTRQWAEWIAHMMSLSKTQTGEAE